MIMENICCPIYKKCSMITNHNAFKENIGVIVAASRYMF